VPTGPILRTDSV